MSMAAIDTLALARKLKEKAHFTSEQAEGVAEAINDVMADELATKRDLDDLRRELRSDMEKMGASLRSDMEKMETAIRSDMEKMGASLRSDTEKLETATRSDFASLRSDMEKMEMRMTIRLGAMQLVLVTAVAALLKLL